MGAVRPALASRIPSSMAANVLSSSSSAIGARFRGSDFFVRRIQKIVSTKRGEGDASFSWIGVEAASGFAAEPAGGDVFFEQRAGAIFRVAEALVEDMKNVHANVEADEIGELERAHGMVH